MTQAQTALFVDDEADIREVVALKFRKDVQQHRIELLFAGDGQEALATLDDRPDINVIFTDLNMPGMDGMTLLQRLKERFSGRTIVVTAYGSYEHLRAAMNQGAFDFLSKPLNFADLEAALQRALDSQREVAVLIQRLTDKHAEVKSLEKRNADLGRQLSGLQAEIAGLRDRVAELEDELAGARARTGTASGA